MWSGLVIFIFDILEVMLGIFVLCGCDYVDCLCNFDVCWCLVLFVLYDNCVIFWCFVSYVFLFIVL